MHHLTLRRSVARNSNPGSDRPACPAPALSCAVRQAARLVLRNRRRWVTIQLATWQSVERAEAALEAAARHFVDGGDRSQARAAFMQVDHLLAVGLRGPQPVVMSRGCRHLVSLSSRHGHPLPARCAAAVRRYLVRVIAAADLTALPHEANRLTGEGVEFRRSAISKR
jgi:hypothetical protein